MKAEDFVEFADRKCGQVVLDIDGKRVGRKISPHDRTDYLLAMLLVKLNEIESILRNSA